MSSATSGVTLAGRMAENKMLVRSVYSRISREDFCNSKSLFHKDFVYTSPEYLPWGGITKTSGRYFDLIVPKLLNAIDYARFTYSSLTNEGNCVVALFNVGIVGSNADVTFCEHWFLEGGLIRSLWSSLFEPLPLLVAIEHSKRPLCWRANGWMPY
jgi:ketosteroid isomerase-like protein